MYRIAVADDEAKACAMIKEIIQQYFEAKALECRVQAYQRPTEMVWDMEKGAGFDIYCIDIEMPGISGWSWPTRSVCGPGCPDPSDGPFPRSQEVLCDRKLRSLDTLCPGRYLLLEN